MGEFTIRMSPVPPVFRVWERIWGQSPSCIAPAPWQVNWQWFEMGPHDISAQQFFNRSLKQMPLVHFGNIDVAQCVASSETCLETMSFLLPFGHRWNQDGKPVVPLVANTGHVPLLRSGCFYWSLNRSTDTCLVIHGCTFSTMKYLQRPHPGLVGTGDTHSNS